jgi:hypothetical protein
MRRRTAVDEIILSDYQMYFSIPTFRRQAINKLHLVGQADENPLASQIVKRPIIPTAAPP